MSADQHNLDKKPVVLDEERVFALEGIYTRKPMVSLFCVVVRTSWGFETMKVKSLVCKNNKARAGGE